MINVAFQRGVLLPDLGLWLDPWDNRELAFVSHAHSDHTGRHAEAILSVGTASLMRARLGAPKGIEHALEFGERREFNGFAATLLPAGHVLGSAQIFIESDAGSLLYTGDFKLRPGLSAEPAGSCPAQTLVMETTYGLPRYRFPPSDAVIRDVVRFCVECREDGDTPVLLGYSLGKAQEILVALRGAGLDIMLHASVWSITRIYEGHGMSFPPYEKLDPQKIDGHVLICPPSVSGSRMLARVARKKVAVLTGWAMNSGAAFRYRCDAAFPLSDHADYTDLLRHVERVQPQRVLTLHGFAEEFARDLRNRGIEAWALTGRNQLDLPGICEPEAERTFFSPDPAAPEDPARGGFDAFCVLCRAIREASGKIAKTRLVADFLSGREADDLASAVAWLTGSPLPERQPIQAGWAVIRRALLAASGLSEGELRSISRTHNDSGLTAAEAIGRRVATPKGAPRAFQEIAAAFRELRERRGPIAKSDVLEQMYAAMTPREAEFLTRIVTGDLRIGLKDGLVEEAIAQAFGRSLESVREAGLVVGNLSEVARLAASDRLGEAEMCLFRPVRAMLASPEPSAGAVWDRFEGEAWVEDKFDGIRAQLHAGEGDAKLFSRDSREMTSTFPELRAAAVRMGGSFVLDGEILAFQDGRKLTFFDLQKRLGRTGGDLFLGAEIPVVFLAFDLLWLDGRSLLRAPLVERRAKLELLDLSDPLRVVDVAFAHSADEIDRLFDAARGRGNEGLMLKQAASLYTPGRRGFSWIKLKKEFATLDVVVVAAEYGHGKRRDVLSDVTFAVRDEKTGTLKTIGKAYSGLTDAEIAELTDEFLGAVRRDDGRRLELEPRVVLEIAFDSIQPSERHDSGLALRFPRIKAIRRDKSPSEIDTLATAKALV